MPVVYPRNLIKISKNLVGDKQVPVCYEQRVYPWRNYLCSSTNSDYGGTSRAFYNPIASFNQFRLLYTNFYSGGATGEANLPSAPGTITVQAMVEEPGTGSAGSSTGAGAPNYPVTFNGASSVQIALHGFAFSDPIDLDFTVGSGNTLWVRTYVQCPNAQYFPCNGLLSPNYTYGLTGYNGTQYATIIPGYSSSDITNVGDNYYQDTGGSGSNNGSNQLTTAGTAWISSSVNYAHAYCPTAIIGQLVSTTPRPIVMGIGDSIMQGDQDTGFGEVGYVARALRTASVGNPSGPLPMLVSGGLGEQIFTLYGSQTYFRTRKSFAQFATHAVCNLGINDVQGAVSFANMKLYATAGAQSLVNRGVKVYWCTLTPFSTSSNSYTTAGAQTVGAYESTRTQWNTYLRSFNSNTAAQNAADPFLSLLSGVFDVSPYCEVNASNVFTLNGGFWYCGPGNNTAYTPDGLHPGPNANYLMQNAINTSLFTVVGQYG